MSIRPPINGNPTSFHPEVIKLGEALERSRENAIMVRHRMQVIHDKNTVASVERRDLQRKLDSHLEWFSILADDEDSEVFLDDGELVIEQF